MKTISLTTIASLMIASSALAAAPASIETVSKAEKQGNETLIQLAVGKSRPRTITGPASGQPFLGGRSIFG
ncbi:hypothetical protein LQT97_18125 [Brucella pseudogrignonensis]|uniref:hypothetical protein n=1 Tax=Brucella pseudogrignonensis TaxID=419475 RepID=UPI001E2F40BE|nr:hypothetical protein [Brucella pseudogrignonensis]MCD4513150.1 hypothetical protein [Brucella pseudogrignonensis]